MREIKFRAWDKTHDPKGRMVYSGNVAMTGSPKIEVMQYTGLKDNTKWNDLGLEESEAWIESGKSPSDWNGREIYEGAIMEYFSGLVPKGGNPIIRKIVKWNSRDCCFEGCFAGKIIGNIYENPELLKEAQ